MASVDMESVKDLRARTGAGMMDCKNALVECGDIEKAVDYLREKGLAKAAKKAERSASQGIVFSNIAPDGMLGVLIELNCETDFVAKTDEFTALGRDLCLKAAKSAPKYISINEVSEGEVERERENCLLEQDDIADPSVKIKDRIISNIAKMGENIVPRRMARFASSQAGRVLSYIHTNGKIGVLLELESGDGSGAGSDSFNKLGHELCMQIAAASPLYIAVEDVPAEDLEREKEIYRKQAIEEGKPASIVGKIADGKGSAFYQDNCLLEQNYIRDPKVKVKELIASEPGKVLVRKMARFAIEV
jgi:elongation factor Ts